MPLPFAVVLDQVGIGSAALLLVVRMPGTPLLLALQHNLVILQVIRNFLAVIIGATSMLALRLTADFLLRTIQGRQKRSLAVRTTARLAQTGSSVDCEMNLRGKDKLAKQSTQFRNCCRVLTASSTTSPLTITEMEQPPAPYLSRGFPLPLSPL